MPERVRVRRRRGSMPRLAAIFIVGLTLAPTVLTAGDAPPQTRDRQLVDCQSCHGNPEFLDGKAPTPEGEAALLVPDTVLQNTRHAALGCADCHAGQARGYPHRAERVAIGCETCHQEPGREWEGSVHAANVAEVGDAPDCVACHGKHRIFGSEDRRSPTHPLNVASLCARCHADPSVIGTYFMAPEEAQARVAVERYYETVHGSALTDAGLVVSATCNDCHRAHDILPADSPGASVNWRNIPDTCGGCHAGVLEAYEGSAHGTALINGRGADERRPPVCTDCHTSHGIVEADDPSWFVNSVEECGECHERVYDTYFETYHGKVNRLGYGLTATCADCHTAHNMLPPSDIESSVHPVNLVETCQQCHPEANENFAKYYAHGDPRDREEYPRLFWPWLFMTSLLVGVFAFFGTHTALWFGRLAIDRVRGSPEQPEPGGPDVPRTGGSSS